MAIYDQQIQVKRRERATELLKQGLTTAQISERTGMGQRAVLRLKKKLEEARGEAAKVKHAQEQAT